MPEMEVSHTCHQLEEESEQYSPLDDVSSDIHPSFNISEWENATSNLVSDISSDRSSSSLQSLSDLDTSDMNIVFA